MNLLLTFSPHNDKKKKVQNFVQLFFSSTLQQAKNSTKPNCILTVTEAAR